MTAMKSPSDQHYRTMHQVEVIYLKNGMYDNRKFSYYLSDEAENIYIRTVNKFKGNSNALVTLRDENGYLIKSFRDNKI